MTIMKYSMTKKTDVINATGKRMAKNLIGTKGILTMINNSPEYENMSDEEFFELLNEEYCCPECEYWNNWNKEEAFWEKVI